MTERKKISRQTLCIHFLVAEYMMCQLSGSNEEGLRTGFGKFMWTVNPAKLFANVKETNA